MSSPQHSASATPTATATPTDPMRRTARIVGGLYLLTFVSIPTLGLYEPIKDHADFVLGAGSDTGVLWGALLEVVVGLAGISTAVVLFPLLRRQNQAAALGLVAARLVETTLIFVSVAGLLTVVTLRNDVAGTADADPASLVTTGHTLAATYDWTFLLSQSLAPVFNALCLGYVLYRSGLVPRVLPTLGLIGAPLLLAADIAIFFGVFDRTGPIALAAVPIAAWEFSLGVYLTVKGFKPSAVAALPSAVGDRNSQLSPA